MRVVVHLAEPLCVDVAVHLRRRQGRMAEELLDRAQVGAALEQMGCERVAEAMRMRDEAAHRRRVETATARRQEERVVRSTCELRARLSEVARDE